MNDTPELPVRFNVLGTPLPDMTQTPLYSQDQMRAFYRQGRDAGVAAERERCAKVCEKANATYGDYFAEAIRREPLE
jgi:hypothetical protein